MAEVKLHPESDGIDHINVYSKGRTPLGRMLSNLTFSPFQLPGLGNFTSVEAFWYWLASGRNNDQIRHLHGHSAKTFGARLPRVDIPEDEFQDLVKQAIRAKLVQNKPIYDEFVKSTLPFVHYYVYGKDAVVPREKHAWQMHYLEELRHEFVHGKPLNPDIKALPAP